MDFPDAVAVVITRPFVLTVTNRGVGTRQILVTAPFIRVASRRRLRRRRDVFLQGRLIRMPNDGEPYLPTFSSKGTDDGRTIIFIGSVPFALIGATTRRIVGVEMRLAFFPPRSETSRRFQSRHLAAACSGGSHIRSFASVVASAGRWYDSPQVLPPSLGWFRLCRRRELTRWR